MASSYTGAPDGRSRRAPTDAAGACGFRAAGLCRAGLFLLAAAWRFASGAAEVVASTSPPGGLAPANTPQIVLLTFDDSVTSASFVRVQQVLTNWLNPNGHPIKATFFVTFGHNYEPYAIRRLYEAGHEIAIHTLSHDTGTNSSLSRWRQEIAGERRTLARLCDMPESDLVGFRAPYLEPNDGAFRVLAERQFLYDSTFMEGMSGLSTSPTNMLWPYTLDHGLQQAAGPDCAPATNYPGLFEIPLWAQFTNGAAAALMSPPESFASNEVVELWQTNFLFHYQGNRAPFGVYLHAASTDQWLAESTNLAWRIGALRAFIGWALEQPDTWFISCSDLANYMLAPVSSSEAASHPSFLRPERIPYPTSAVSRCSYPHVHTFSVCGSCPPAEPTYTNAYLGLVPMEGGAVALNVVSQSEDYAWCTMTVSNDVPNLIYNWSVNFTLAGGEVQGHHDATVTQAGDQVVAAARQYNMQIEPGAGRVLTFRVLRSGGEVSFGNACVEASGLGPQPIRLDLRSLSDPAGWRLSWDDNAYVYGLDCSTNLLDPQGWSALTNELCQPVFTDAPSADGAPRFYRVRGTVY